MITYSKWLIFGGIVAMLIGLLSLLGWAFDHAALVSAVPAIANMTFNTAFCFVLLGLTLLLPRSWRRICLGGAVIVGLFALLMLLQQVFGINLGIDNLLYNHYIAYPDNPHPGRMATITTLAFISSSIALQFIIYGCHEKWNYYTTSILISAIGIASLYGILMSLIYTEVPVVLTYQLSMSLMTAIGFLSLSIALWCFYRVSCHSRISQDVFYPVIELMFKLSFPKKFLLIALVFSVPLVFSMQYTLESLSKGMEQAENDLSGIHFLRGASKLLISTQRHRGIVNAQFNGDQSFEGTIIERDTEEVIASLLYLRGWVHRSRTQQYEIDMLNEIEKEWRFVSAEELNGDANALWQVHSRMIEQITQMTARIGSKLSYNLESNLIFHNISDAAIDHLPQLMEIVGKMRGLGTGYLAKKEIGAIGRYRISNLSEQARLQLQKTIAHLSDIEEAEQVRGTIGNQTSELEKASSAFQNMTRKVLLDEESLSANSAYYFMQGTSVIKSASQLQSMMLDYLSIMLTEEIEHKNEQLYLTTSIAAASLLLIIFLFLAFYRSIMLMIGSLAETAERMKHGDMREPELKPEDELGHVVHSFNTIAGELTRVSANMQAIFNYAIDGIITINLEGVITAINPAAEKIFGYTQEELVGNNIAMLMPERYRARHAAGLAAKVSGGSSNIIGRSLEVEGLHKDGSIFPIDLSVNEMEVSGQGRLFIGMVRDVRKRKNSEAEIRRLAAVVEQAVESIVITDPEGVIQYVNPAFERLNGFSKKQAIGNYPRVLKSGKEKKELYQELWKTIKAGDVWKAHLTNRRRDGSHYNAEHTISPIFGSNGEITNFVGFQRDVTAETVLKSQMEHAQRLESLGVLAGGIAHDFNNILTAIMGNVALAERRLDSGSPAMEFLSRVEDSTQSAANLCKQMLAYSGKGTFEIKPVNLSDLVEDISRLMEVSIRKSILLRYQLAASLPAVEADESQLQQVVLNLITNANEAIEDKSGVISLTTGIMHADSEYLLSAYTNAALPEGRYVYLEVSDTGCGMDSKTMSSIFDPFFTTKFTGRGLGMSAVIGIVNSHRGALKVYSEIGRGTTFKLLLPAVGTEAFQTSEESEVSDHRQGHGTVLIVDDEDTIREVAAIMLEDMGFKTLSAPDGLQALSVYRQHQNEIICVLLDMTMPKMDGAKCFSQLRKINPDVQVILSSGYTELDATPDFIGKGLAGFIQKPYALEALQGKLQEVLKEDS